MLLIKNGHVLDPQNNIDDILDVLIKDDKIIEIKKNITCSPDTDVISAENMWVVPGLIDMHVHLRDPGLTYKEDIKSGTLSAACGGVTTICAMPNTIPVVDSPKVVKYIKDKCEKEAVVNVLVISSITKNQDGTEIVDISSLKNSGIIALSEDGKSVSNPEIFKEALNITYKLNLPILDHCEDNVLKNGGVINDGPLCEKYNVKGISKETEDSITLRDINLAKKLKNKLHICHISTDNSVNIVREAKKENPNLTCEVCPHHFSSTENDILSNDGNYKMSPPLRDISSVNEILKGLKDGTIDVIATDHAPHSIEEKDTNLNDALNGIVGLETLVPLTITNLVNKNILTPMQFVEKTSLNPAKILGLNKGTLSINSIADITIIDPNEKFKIDKNDFKSKSKNTYFHGKEVFGKVKYTLVNGKIVFKS